MPSLDLAMPIALLVVITVAMLLNKRVEGKLMATVEEKEFKTRDIILLIVFHGNHRFSYSLHVVSLIQAPSSRTSS